MAPRVEGPDNAEVGVAPEPPTAVFSGTTAIVEGQEDFGGCPGCFFIVGRSIMARACFLVGTVQGLADVRVWGNGDVYGARGFREVVVPRRGRRATQRCGN